MKKLSLCLLVALGLKAEENGVYFSLGYLVGEVKQQISVGEKALEAKQQLRNALSQAIDLSQKMVAPSPRKTNGWSRQPPGHSANIWGNNPTQVAASSVLQAANDIASLKHGSSWSGYSTKATNLCDIGSNTCDVLNELKQIIAQTSSQMTLTDNLQGDVVKRENKNHQTTTSWQNQNNTEPTYAGIKTGIQKVAESAKNAIEAITLTRDNAKLAKDILSNPQDENISTLYDSLSQVVHNNQAINNANTAIGNALDYINKNLYYGGLGDFACSALSPTYTKPTNYYSDARLSFLSCLLKGTTPNTHNYPYAQGGFVKEQNALASAFKGINKRALVFYDVRKSPGTTTTSGALNGAGLSLGYKHFFGKRKAIGFRYSLFVDYNYGSIASNTTDFNSVVSFLTYGFDMDLLLNFINDEQLRSKKKLSMGFIVGVGVGATTFASSLKDKLTAFGKLKDPTIFQLLGNFGVRLNIARYKDKKYKGANSFELGAKVPAFNVNYYSNNDGNKLSYKRVMSFYINYAYAF
ncbi:outer membrane protein [Helicobacter cetorum]|uniref:Outer membrane protein HopH n=1 Tax=Helicobacter cetorum (strain ATCC BAA-540 / CCUG 52418 / MIT 99-5656) TaxID=1163745 RepID=I0ERZ1_HELCM|nr:outer membrane protein [Helicobacter cetorum]AFI05710.1 outer membrane protein HopH [Helicobacter cetorum MIT 99-5656]